MQQLYFNRYSTTEWREFKRIHQEKFWEELYAKTLNDAKKMIQKQIYEEFNIQIGAERYRHADSRQDKRNGFRYRSFEILS